MMETLFDAQRARELRDIGIAKVSSYPNETWVSRAKNFVLWYASKHGEVTADDLWEHLPPPENANPSIVGAVFRQKNLKFTGELRQSTRVDRHASSNRVWKLA